MIVLADDYIQINKKAFDLLAPEYNRRNTEEMTKKVERLKVFERRLLQNFRAPIKVLDAGCGVGIDALALSLQGFKVHGIDISNKMLNYAKKNAPFATFQQINFLDYNGTRFNGILMHAFIHLFPSNDTSKVLSKIRRLLYPKGIVLVSTTYSSQSKEGYYGKNDYNDQIKRYRRFWTKNELISAFEKENFKLINYYLDRQEKWNKDWMNFIFQRN